MNWDAGVHWHLEVVTPPAVRPFDLAWVGEQHLRVGDWLVEADYLAALIDTATRMAERTTRRALLPQTLRLVLDRFPCGPIVLPRPPLQAVTSIVYVDPDGVTQSLASSPPAWRELAVDAGAQSPRGSVWTLAGESWPAVRIGPGAVQVTYEAGYRLDGSESAMPDDILHGMLLVIGELYQQRTLSVHAMNQNPSIVTARDLWLAYRVHGRG